MNPLVSICIPSYRQPELLSRALSSVFAQNYKNFEVIVTDDSDSDEVEIVSKNWLSDGRLRYVRNSIRLGSPKNWNFSMALARGKYIKFLHHDDWFVDEFSLSKYVNALEDNPGVFFAFSASNTCLFDGEFVSVHTPSKIQLEELENDRHVLIHGNFVGAPSATIFRNSAEFEFDVELKWVVDIDAYVRLLGGNGLFIYISDPLVSVTSEGAHQVTQQIAIDPVLRIAEHLYLYRKFYLSKTQRVATYCNVSRLFSGLDFYSLKSILKHPLTGSVSAEIYLASLVQGFKYGLRTFRNYVIKASQ